MNEEKIEKNISPTLRKYVLTLRHEYGFYSEEEQRELVLWGEKAPEVVLSLAQNLVMDRDRTHLNHGREYKCILVSLTRQE
ncbi:MAG TPA: hypothetical protein VJY47_03490 [Candidatus Dojkabacteria bacterium]|nr:hypothetical protein [Candidatus Dojkabacteria bacterium]